MWYTASLLFVSDHVGCPKSEPVWEEQIVLFEAEDENDARQKAMLQGNDKQHEYLNKEGCLVRWVFKHIERVYPIDGNRFEDGMELFSRFLRDSEVKSLLTPFSD